MKFRIMAALLCSTVLSVQAMAGLPEAIRAFDQQSYRNAFAEFSYLAEEGDPTAVYYLGLMYQNGYGVEKDVDKALSFFRLADKGFNPDAAVQLGKMLMNGEGVSQNTELGLQFLKKAAYAGNESALLELGNAYINGTGVEKNNTYAFGFYFIGAMKGDMRAQYRTAQAYLNGRGIPQDYREALKWFSRSANQGYVLAQKELANILETNPQVQNLLEAYAWYSILAAYNSDDVGKEAEQKRNAISAKIKNTKELVAQQQKVREWHPVSAEKTVSAEERRAAVMPVIIGFNDPQTMQQMLESDSILLRDGSAYNVSTQMVDIATKTNNRTELEEAVQEAADKGKSEAYAYYADLLQGRFDDPTAAALWYQKGADAGSAYAQYQLGKLYCEGRGVENPDPVKCYGWLLLAENTDDNMLALSVKNAILAVEAEATPEELKQGKEFAAQQGSAQEQRTVQKKRSVFKLF